MEEDDEGVEFTESAFRHKISKKDIKHALKTKVLVVPLVCYPQKNALIGFDQAGNPLEILYNEIDYDRTGSNGNLNDLLTQTNPEFGPNETGFLSRKEADSLEW